MEVAADTNAVFEKLKATIGNLVAEKAILESGCELMEQRATAAEQRAAELEALLAEAQGALAERPRGKVVSKDG